MADIYMLLCDLAVDDFAHKVAGRQDIEAILSFQPRRVRALHVNAVFLFLSQTLSHHLSRCRARPVSGAATHKRRFLKPQRTPRRTQKSGGMVAWLIYLAGSWRAEECQSLGLDWVQLTGQAHCACAAATAFSEERAVTAKHCF